nr:hypothetical conserved protein [uncultured Gammaproteobacteria bacterium]
MLKVLTWLCLALALPAKAWGREFGFFIGDVVERCVPLAQPARQIVTPLPAAAGRFLSVRAARVQGRILCLRYQVESVPVTTETVAIPAWRIKLLAEKEREVEIPAWQLVLSPLRPLQGLSAERFMLGENLPPSQPLPGWWWTGAWILVLSGTLGHLWCLALGRSFPFCRSLWRLTKGDRSLDEALLIVLGAFESYLQGLSLGRMEAFVAAYPHFAGLSRELARFDQAVRQRFFLQTQTDLTVKALKALAWRLALAEIRRGGLA